MRRSLRVPSRSASKKGPDLRRQRVFCAVHRFFWPSSAICIGPSGKRLSTSATLKSKLMAMASNLRATASIPPYHGHPHPPGSWSGTSAHLPGHRRISKPIKRDPHNHVLRNLAPVLEVMCEWMGDRNRTHLPYLVRFLPVSQWHLPCSSA